MDAKQNYEHKRDALAEQYIELQVAGQAIRLNKKVSNLFRERSAKAAKLDVRSFNGVISIDAEGLTAEVEGMAPYRTVVRETLKYGLLPAVVPELATITVGGAVSGGGIEASSFKYGLVHETILAMDVLLPSGKVVEVTPNNQYKDLFYGLANSFGTLGYILKLTIKLVQAKEYVELQHLHFTEMSKLLTVIEEVSTTGMYKGRAVDFMDGVGFEPKDLYLTLSYFTDAPESSPSNYRYMRSYYQSLKTKKRDYLTAEDFIWRWDSDWFWCSKNFYMNRALPRLLFGKWMLRSEAYWRLVRFDQRHHIDKKLRKVTGRSVALEDVIQDVQIPIEKSDDFWRFFTKNLPIRPVWFCPTRSSSADKYPLYRLEPNKTYVNFGFWDHALIKPGRDANYYNKLVEAEVTKLHGMKGLYSEAFYAEKEFWRIYNGTAYKKLKTSYDPKGNLKDLYQKCVKGA